MPGSPDGSKYEASKELEMKFAAEHLDTPHNSIVFNCVELCGKR